jgi:cell division protein FtsA
MRSTSIANLKQALQQNHLNPGHIHHGASMSGLACLSEEEKDLGSLVLDIGGGTSSLSLFMEGKVIYTDTIAIGGIQLTRDIAKVLSISIQEAERLKVFEGTVFAPSPVSHTASARSSGIPSKGDNFILSGSLSDLDTITLSNSDQIERDLLNNIIKTRLEEILEKLMAELVQAHMHQAVGNRVILVGGTAKLTGICEFVSSIWKKNARMGIPNHISGLGGREDIEPLSAALGMANYIQSYPQNEPIQHQTRAMPFGRFGRIGNWLIENI